MLQFFNLFKVPAFSIAWLAVNFAWVGCAAHFMPGKSDAIFMIWVATLVFLVLALNVPAPTAKKGIPAAPAAAAPAAPDFQKDLRECAEGTLTIDEFCERWKGAVPAKTGYHRPIFPDTKFPEIARKVVFRIPDILKDGQRLYPHLPISNTPIPEAPKGFRVGDCVREKRSGHLAVIRKVNQGAGGICVEVLLPKGISPVTIAASDFDLVAPQPLTDPFAGSGMSSKVVNMTALMESFARASKATPPAHGPGGRRGCEGAQGVPGYYAK